MARNDPMTTVCKLVADARRAGQGFGPFLARGGDRGLFFNAGGDGVFLHDDDLDALAADGYLSVWRDAERNGQVTILERAIRECGDPR